MRVNKAFLQSIFFSLAVLAILETGFADDKEPPKMDLEKIIVTPSRFAQYYRNSSVNISVVDEKDIKSGGAEEITKVLDELPDLDIIDYGSYGATKSISMRGASAAQVVTLIDGRPLNTPRDGSTDFNQIPLDNIERIEVMRGPASSIYGANAVGGVINIITKSGKEKMFTQFETKTGSFLTETIDFAHGWKTGALDYFISTDYIQSNGFRENADYEQQNYNIKLGYDVGKDNRFTFASGYNASDAGVPGKEGEDDLNDRQEEWRNYLDLTWEVKGWEDSQMLFKLYQNHDRLEFIESLSPTLQKDTNCTKACGADLQLSRTWFDKFRTSLGASGQGNKLNSSTSGNHKYNFKAAYGEAELDLWEDLAIKGGLRIDDYSNFGNRTSPSASFSWWFFDKIKAHGLAAKSFRAPTFNDLYWPKEDWGIWGGVEGNPNLKPERATSGEIGLGAFLFNAAEADVTYFHTRCKDMIAWSVDDTQWWRPSNVNTAITEGVEASLDYQATRALKLNVNYTRLSAINNATKKWLIYRPRHQCKGGIAYDLTDRLNCRLSGRYLSKRYTVEDNSSFLKDYFVADAYISYSIFKSGEITLTVNNLLDRDYQEEQGYPMPGTSFLAGAKIKF